MSTKAAKLIEPHVGTATLEVKDAPEGQKGYRHVWCCPCGEELAPRESHRAHIIRLVHAQHIVDVIMAVPS